MEEIQLENQFHLGSPQAFPAIVFTNTFNASFDKVCHNVVPINERNETTDIKCQQELEDIINLSSQVDNTSSTIEYISALCEIIAPLPHPKVSIPLRLKARLSDKPGQAHKHTKVSMTSQISAIEQNRTYRSLFSHFSTMKRFDI